MNADRDALMELAQSVSDGEAVDWDRAEREAESETERDAVRQLCIVASISGHDNPSPDLEETVESSVDSLPFGEWGSLELQQRIGSGAFGDVYRARDTGLDRAVALKLLHPEVSGKGSVGSKMIKEGRLMARVEHANVVTVYGAEEHAGRVGIWMELIEGRSLAELLQQQGPFGAREATLIGVDVCRALSAVHRAGLIHRDIKAQNVMRGEGGRIVLMDFSAGLDVAEIEETDRRTLSGTPLYMAPELFEGGSSGTRSDIYSMGVLLYYLVCGSFPVKGRSMNELIERHRGGQTKLLRDRRSDLPESFVTIVERALSRDPAARFATAGEMEQALSATLGLTAPVERERAPRRIWLPLAAIAAVLVLVLVLVLVAVGLSAVLSPVGEDATPQPRTSAADDPVTRPVEPAEAESYGDATGAEVENAAPPPAADSYTVEATPMRYVSGRPRRLEPGQTLAVGDTLTLEFRASRSLHVYVINEPDEGRPYALFPLPDFDLQNPLAANETHELPGMMKGMRRTWEVTSAGGRERLLIVASPERWIEFEAEMSKLARPGAGQSAVQLSPRAKMRLRGIGGLAELDTHEPAGSAGKLFEMAERLQSRKEVVEGAWVRQLEFENPKREP